MSFIRKISTKDFTHNVGVIQNNVSDCLSSRYGIFLLFAKRLPVYDNVSLLRINYLSLNKILPHSFELIKLMNENVSLNSLTIWPNLVN